MNRNACDETTKGRDRTTVLEWAFPYLLKRRIMKIQKMSKEDLINSIEKAENLLNNKRWVKQQTKFWIGVYINHLAKNRNELKNRG